LLVIGAIVYGVYSAYGKVRDSYSVLFDTASTPGIELEALRDKFQGETQATIIVSDPAKKFVVGGRYEGACVQDLLESICRQYSGKLVCSTSLLKRTVTVGLK
jgi:hypothetical protein